MHAWGWGVFEWWIGSKNNGKISCLEREEKIIKLGGGALNHGAILVVDSPTKTSTLPKQFKRIYLFNLHIYNLERDRKREVYVDIYIYE